MASQLILPAPSNHRLTHDLTKKQSLALVKIFLNSSLACICHARALLDWRSDCIRTRFVDQISLDNVDAYDTFRESQPSAPGASQETRILVRSNNAKGNGLLDLIEHGVFQALEASYLDVLQVFIMTDQNTSKAIRETYTYSFTYHGNTVASVEFREQHQFLSLSDAQKSFKSGIRCLLRSMKDLPTLPNHCSLGMSIAYTEDCPQHYQPNGFLDAKHHDINSEDWTKLWQQPAQEVSKFEAAHHSLTLAARNSTLGHSVASQQQDTALSKHLQGLQNTSSENHPGLVSTLTAPLSPLRSPVPKEVMRPVRTAKSKSRSGTARSPVRHKESGSAVRHSDVAQAANPLKDLTMQSKNRRRRDVVPEKMAEAIVQAYCLDFEAEDGETLFDSVQLSRGVLFRIEQSDTIRCECGRQTRDEEGMLFCHLCNSSQHSRCYGTMALRPTSQPAQHLCYSCLLLPRESSILHGMERVVHVRSALNHLSSLDHDAVDVQHDLVSAVFGDIDVNAEKKNALIECLLAENILEQPNVGISKILTVEDEVRTRLQTEYLDPLAKISHLYRVIRTNDSSTTKARELQEELKKYSRGNDYTSGQGAEDTVVIDSFGRAVVRWGYHNQGSKRQAVDDPQESPSPRRRKISISRVFIALDRSTPVSSEESGDEDATRCEAIDHDATSLAASTITDL